MVRPSPVPPYLRVVEVSSCSNARKIFACLSSGMPMPVSVTVEREADLTLLYGLVGVFHEDHNLAAFCELDRVANEIDEHLAERAGVAYQSIGHVRPLLAVPAPAPSCAPTARQSSEGRA